MTRQSIISSRGFRFGASCVTAILLLLISHAATAGASEQAGQFETAITRAVVMKYKLYLPAGYSADPQRKWPLILYLHGGSVRGDDLEKVASLGLPRYAAEHPELPFIVVAPLLRARRMWSDTDALIALIDEIEKSYSVDPARVYLTGHSIGGNGAWYLAYQHPERFAAVVPISGPALVWWAPRLAGVPIKVFHGDRDDLVSVDESRAMVRAIESEGGHADLVVLHGRNHFILDVYEDRALYEWLLRHRRE